MMVVLVLANPAAAALQAGTFTQYPLRPTTAAAGMQLTRLAVLDASPQSRQWLRDNAAYLTAQQIPVMVLHSSPADSAALLADYQGSGLLLGVERHGRGRNRHVGGQSAGFGCQPALRLPACQLGGGLRRDGAGGALAHQALQQRLPQCGFAAVVRRRGWLLSPQIGERKKGFRLWQRTGLGFA